MTEDIKEQAAKRKSCRISSHGSPKVVQLIFAETLLRKSVCSPFKDCANIGGHAEPLCEPPSERRGLGSSRTASHCWMHAATLRQFLGLGLSSHATSLCKGSYGYARHHFRNCHAILTPDRDKQIPRWRLWTANMVGGRWHLMIRCQLTIPVYILLSDKTMTDTV